MTIKMYADKQVEVNEEGFLTNHLEWTEKVADAVALEEKITLTENHWKIINYLRKEFQEKGEIPTLRKMKNSGGIETKEFYALFPDGPLKKAARIAGLPKPKSCI